MFLAAAAVAAALTLFLLFGPPRLVEHSESPEFCATCHVHDSHYESFSHWGAHRRGRCVDCHLPNDTAANHFFWKGVDGAKDLALFHSGLFSERLRLTEHGRHVLQANCIRCHETTVAHIDPDRPCWECHRRAGHKGAALAKIQ